MQLVGAGLCYPVDDAPRRASQLRPGAARDPLGFLDRIECNVDSGTLPAHLLPEEAVVVVAAIKTDVVEDSTLPGKADLIAVGPLHYAYAGSEREQIFKFPAQNRRLLHRLFVERGT